MDIKRVNDYENAKKLESKEFKNSLINFNKKLESYYKIINSSKKILHFSNLYIFLLILTSNTFIPLVIMIINFCIINYLNKMINKLDQIKVSAKNSINDELVILSETIDSCELLKSFLRGKELNTENLSKIISYLYLDFGNELNIILDEIIKNNDCSIKLIDDSCINAIEYENNLEYEYKDEGMKRILKR